MLLKDALIGRTYTVESIHLPFQLERFGAEPKREGNFNYQAAGHPLCPRL